MHYNCEGRAIEKGLYIPQSSGNGCIGVKRGYSVSIGNRQFEISKVAPCPRKVLRSVSHEDPFQCLLSVFVLS